MGRKRKTRIDQTGRNPDRVGSAGAVIIIRRSLWLSPQVSVLSPLARSLMVELTALYSGPRNGGLVFLSVRDAARRCGVSDLTTMSSGFRELLDVGLIIEAVGSHFAVKAGGRSRARGFRLMWKSDDGSQLGPHALPALAFSAMDAKQKRRVEDRSKAIATYSKISLPVLDSHTLTAIRADMTADSVMDSHTLTPKNGSNALAAVVRDSHTYIYYHGGAGAGPYLHRQSIKSSGPQIERRAALFVAGSTDRFCRMVKLRRGQNIIEREAA